MRKKSGTILPAGIVGLWSLAILALERYVVVCRPLGDFRFQHRHAVSGCAFTWSWSLLWTTPPLLGWSSYVPEGRGGGLRGVPSASSSPPCSAFASVGWLESSGSLS